jgi:heme/copper-type cytochrome/quinol oxidase subunit 2
MIAESLLLAALPFGQLWYYLPLVVAISLVYGATRHELPGPILRHAWHTAVWMTMFIGTIFVVVYILSLLV